MPAKTIRVVVISDLETDQRVRKTCETLVKAGYSVELTGRKGKHSGPLSPTSYPRNRVGAWFHKNIPFFAEFQCRLLFSLLKGPADLIYANDLDSLPAAWLAAQLRRVPLVYDSHEFYTGMPELSESPLKRRIWRSLEHFLVPRTQARLTVNESIAQLLQEQYGKEFSVLRNLPMAQSLAEPQPTKSRAELGWPEEAFIMILQGGGINMQRGAEEAIAALKHLPNHVYLATIGSGDMFHRLPEIAESLGVRNRLLWHERMPYKELLACTRLCQLGLSLDKPLSINYRLSLPNKLFDYMQAGVPVLSSDLIELRKVLKAYETGWMLPEVSPTAIAKAVKRRLNDPEGTRLAAENCQRAAKELVWEKDAPNLLAQIEQAFSHARS